VESIDPEKQLLLSLAPRVRVTDEAMHQGIAELRVGMRTLRMLVGLTLVLLFTVLVLVVLIAQSFRVFASS
jgi:hypothetical protein